MTALPALLGGAAFALAGIAPRRYERLPDAGAATGVIDLLLVRVYLPDGDGERVRHVEHRGSREGLSHARWFSPRG